VSELKDKMLQLTREEMQELGYRLVDLVVDHFDRLSQKPVARKKDRAALEKCLREAVPEKGVPMDRLLDQLQEDILGNMIHSDHPRFFAFVPSPSNFVSAMADMVAAGFNVFTGTWLESSGPSEVELVTIDWLRQLCGLPSSTAGLFVSGGSVANLTALAVARQVMLGHRIKEAVLYCSDQTHSSVERGARLLGFEPSQLRKLPTDDQYRLSMPELRRAVVLDRNGGRVPFCVVANAGTTNTGAIDPLPELVEFCRKEGLWLHVDGAYGAAAVITRRGAELLQGLEAVDSLVLDPHKWLFQPFEMGCVLVREGRRLKETFRVRPEYLKDVYRADEEVNFCDYGIQLTRGFRALKLWMSIKYFGLEQFRSAVERGLELAGKVEALLSALPHWEVVTPAQLGIVTARYLPPGKSPAEVNAINRMLIDEVINDGYAMVSSTELRGRTVLRFCTINPRTTEEDLAGTVERLDMLARTAARRLEEQALNFPNVSEISGL